MADTVSTEAGKDDTKVAKGDDEAVESFWSNTSYKVINRGKTSTAMVDLIVPSDKMGLPYGQENIAKEQEKQAAAKAGERNEWGMQPVNIPADEINFPWACPSAVSDAVYSEGVHEFVVEVGCIGLLGFIDTAFVDERTKVLQSWVTESNIGRVWLLHGSGYVAEGTKTKRAKQAKFCSGDHILLRLDLFKGHASWTCVNGPPRLLASVQDIKVDVRLGFQMYAADDSVTLVSHRDVTDAMDPRERAEGHHIRGQRFLAMAAPLSNAGPDQDEAYVKLISTAISSFDKASRAFSNLQDAAAKDKSLELYLECKKGSDAAHERIAKRYEIKEDKL